MGNEPSKPAHEPAIIRMDALYILLKECEQNVKTLTDKQKYRELLNNRVRVYCANIRQFNKKIGTYYTTKSFYIEDTDIQTYILLFEENKLPKNTTIKLDDSSWKMLIKIHTGKRKCINKEPTCDQQELFCECVNVPEEYKKNNKRSCTFCT